MRPLISIVVPAYNSESFLGNCLDSILNQTYPAIEILVIDDGSTDNTLQIAKQYQVEHSNQIRVYSTENRGVTKARFCGIEQAKGEWIGFVDADDELEPDMYERLYGNAQIYNADISHCGHVTIVNGGERIHEFYNTGCLVQQNREKGLKDLLDGPVEPSLCTKLIKRNLLKTVIKKSMMDTSVKYNEDLLMNYLLFSEASKSVYEDFCGYRYMARISSATRAKSCDEKITNPVTVWKLILDYSESEIKEIAWRKYLVACSNAYVFFANQKRHEAVRYREILLNKRNKWELLSRNEYIKLRLSLTSLGLYNFIYKIYKKHFQKKIYE